MTSPDPQSNTRSHENGTDQMLIEAQGLTVRFGKETVIQDVSFAIPRGKIFGFIGPSGSGKTTTVRLLTGFYKPTTGQAGVLGHSPAEFTREIREKIGYLPQQFVFYPNLTVWENLNFTASIYGLNFDREERLNELLAFVELIEHKNKLARNLSGGMKRRLSLAATLINEPELLFMDEPTAGIDPILRRRFWDHFKTLQQQGRTLFITTQYVGEAAYCDLVGVMSKGRLLIVETPEGLRRRAFGGQIVHLYTEERLTHKDLQTLANLPFVRKEITRLKEQEGMTANGICLVVEEARIAIPALLTWCQNEYVSVRSIEEYLPPFDDVFVELVKNDSTDVK